MKLTEAEETASVATPNQYMGSYSNGIVNALAKREFQTHGKFFLPYLHPSMNLLDCGCGPGTMTVDIAEQLHSGQVTGIDIQSTQFDVGKQIAVDRGLNNVRFQEASICHLPFADNEFDAVFAHAVLYHLATPELTLAEINRVMKPGGIIGIRDSDYGGEIFNPCNTTLHSAWDLLRKIHEHGGSNPYFGRNQKAELRHAGFEVLEATASYDSFGTPALTRQIGTTWSKYLRQKKIKELVIEQRWANAEQLQEMSSAFLSWGRDPDAFYARTRCEAVGRKQA